MINETYLSLSLIAALFIFMLDYGLGHPANEKAGYGSFLFAYSFFLAKRRMKLAGLYADIYDQYKAQKPNDLLHAHRLKRQFQELIFTQGREMFSWEKAFGMCPYCTHFWFSIVLFTSVNIFYLQANIITFSLYFLLSHLLLRLFIKWTS